MGSGWLQVRDEIETNRFRVHAVRKTYYITHLADTDWRAAGVGGAGAVAVVRLEDDALLDDDSRLFLRELGRRRRVR